MTLDEEREMWSLQPMATLRKQINILSKKNWPEIFEA